MSDILLRVNSIVKAYGEAGSRLEVLRGVSLAVYDGESVSICGESGSGKSVTAMATLGLLPQPGGLVLDGEIHFQGRKILDRHLIDEKKWRGLRGAEIACIFQDPAAALDPLMTLGAQWKEAWKKTLSAAVKSGNIERAKRIVTHLKVNLKADSVFITELEGLLS